MKAGTLALLLAAAALLCAGTAPAQAPDPFGEMLERSHLARLKGDSAAPVLIVGVSDFQCPFCAEFARTTMPALDSAYIATGRARFLFVNLPLPMHRAAWRAAEAAMCAGAQEAFWPMHDLLFAEQGSWGAAEDPGGIFNDLAARLGLDTERFRRCTEEDQVAILILDDLMQATRAGASGTPLFIINGVRTLSGVQPLETFRTVIEELLAEP